MEEIHLSATRVVDWLTCPSLYQRKHILRLPSPRKAATEFGTALHRAIEEWHELGDHDHPIREVWYASYAKSFPTVWPVVRPMVIQAQILDDMEISFRKRRPDIKAPRQTKEWLTSQEWAVFCDMQTKMAEAVISQETEERGLVFNKTESPYKLWVLGLDLLDRYVQAWQSQPDPLAVEIGFENQTETGIWIRGRIDIIRPIVNLGTGEYATATIDVKSGTKQMTPQSAFVQGTIYAHATRCGWLPDEYASDIVLFHSLRDGTIQPFTYTEECWTKLLHIMDEVVHGLKRKKYPKAFSIMSCGMCDYKDACATELGVFPSGPMAAEAYLSGTADQAETPADVASM